MKHILFLLVSLLLAGESFALPPCPTSGYFDNCFGTQTFASGNKYVGEIKDGKFHGQGTFTYANGDKYVGEFKGGKFHGQGTFTWVDGGKKLVGEYKQGKKWEGIKYLASGRVFGTFSNGKWCQGCKPTARQLAIVDEINSSSKVTEFKPKEDKTESEAVSAFGAIASAIKQKISKNWSEPGDFSGLSVEFLVKVDREGNVLSVTMTRSSGDARLDESAENAIFKASPLPFPGEARFYEYLKEFNFIFKPEWSGRTSQNNRETEERQDKQKQFSVEAQSGGESKWVEWRLGEYNGQYKGQLKNGAPNGYGVFSVRRKKTDDFPWVSATISGRWKDGAPEGKVNVSLEGDGDEFKSAQYAGEMNAVGDFHGHGVLTIEGNEGVVSVVGTWKDDKPWNANVWADGEKVWEYIEGEDSSDNRSGQIATTPQKPTLTVKSNVGSASVYIDSAYKGATELKIQLPSSYYSIRVSKTGYNDFHQRVDLKESTVLWASLTKVPETKPKEDKIVAAASGTGFFVSRSGHIITNHHVIEDCKAVKVSFKGDEVKARVLAIDKFNDLAILKSNLTPSHVYSVSNEDVQLLEDVVIAGYPLGKRISASIKTSKGSVTSLAGYGDNYSEFQTDAALNQGNSGGPIMDQKGNVVGVAVSKLVQEGVESFNFGIKASTLKTFARSNNLTFLPPNNRDLSNRDLGKLITNATLYIECWMTVAQIKQKIAEAENRKAFFSEFE